MHWQHDSAFYTYSTMRLIVLRWKTPPKTWWLDGIIWDDIYFTCAKIGGSTNLIIIDELNVSQLH